MQLGAHVKHVVTIDAEGSKGLQIDPFVRVLAGGGRPESHRPDLEELGLQIGLVGRRVGGRGVARVGEGQVAVAPVNPGEPAPSPPLPSLLAWTGA